MSKERLRTELIQVAAVAVAIVEDLDYGEANYLHAPNYNLPTDIQGSEVLEDVASERLRQDEKWGPQSHDSASWLLILMEEVGEAAEEVFSVNRRPSTKKEQLVRKMSLLGSRIQWFLDEVLFR